MANEMNHEDLFKSLVGVKHEDLFKDLKKPDFRITGKWGRGLDLMGTLGSLKVGQKLRIAIPISETHELRIVSTITSRRKVKVKS